ncbi:transcription antitermination factor NusB [Methylocystis bryophila]|uniref:Transcription antitermination protein NusB n=1 Tax=Methylocystis bryophila TaxID=655015 RepID=A0A1W6MYQ8_9HYPH|nr:transcription antitermination factor NusB [Methylocystis bryophila]ARN82693.1 N utilization substance protein B [Methylocystis bryophila]BDV38918.1 N utilization substance protein B [Methylocystis bryophila]
MKAAERSNARLAVVQALYQMEVAGKGLHEVQAEFEAHWMGREIEGAQYRPAAVGFFREVLGGVLEEQRLIDTKIDAALSGGWPLSRIETVMRAILRAGAFELMRRPDVPASVAIKEYVDVAGAFFGPTECGMINAVLDRLARETRAAEKAKS